MKAILVAIKTRLRLMFYLYGECCVCHKRLWGVKWPWGKASHGYCEPCHIAAIKKAEEEA